MGKAVFLDRDGTMAEDVHYCSRPQDLRLFPDVGEGVRRLNDKGFKVVIITNQSGIARGYFTEPALAEIHQKLKGDLAQYGAHIDAIYHCPHHPARAIGSKSVLIANDLGISEIKDSHRPPDYIAPDFGAAVKWIIKQPEG